jgi:hypothetical protein
MFWGWAMIWYFFSLVGRDPIHISNPIVVNNESAVLASDSNDYG